MHEISKRMKFLQVFNVSASKGDGAGTWGTGVISFTSGSRNGVKYSLFHRPLGGVGPKQHRPALYSLSIKHFTLQWSTMWWTHAQYKHTVELVHLLGVRGLLIMEFIVRVCEGLLLWSILVRENNVCAFASGMHLWSITDGWFYSADFVILFTSENFSHR